MKDPASEIVEVARAVRQQWIAALAVAFLIIGTTVVLTALQNPRYEASATTLAVADRDAQLGVIRSLHQRDP